MSVVVKKIDAFKKNRDNTVEVGRQPNLLREDRKLYGRLEEENKMDLKIGSDGFQDEGYDDMYHSLFDYVKKTSRQGTPLKEVIGADFVSPRRNLVTLSKWLYSKEDIKKEDRKKTYFEIAAIRKNGVIFLCETVKDVQPWESIHGHGFKFELYMTMDDNGQPHDVNERPSNAECFKSVLRTSVRSGSEEIKIYCSAEVDARDRHGNSVELTSTCNGYPKWLEHYSLKRYLSAVLGGVTTIVKGYYRKYEDVVIKVDKVIVSDIPNMNVNWNPQACFEKLFEILKEVKSQLQLDDQALIIRGDKENIYYEPGDINNLEDIDPNFLRYFE